jgi:hypothetical protein
MWCIGGMCGRWVTVIACWLALGCLEEGPDARVLTEPLLVDAELDVEQRAAVQAAVTLWSDATEGRFAPELRFGAVQCGDSFAIEAVHTQGCSIGLRVQTDEGRIGQVLGATEPEQHSVAVATWLRGDAFRDLVAHELGHYLLLGHGEGIMAQPRQRLDSEVSAASRHEFCATWGC